MSFTYGEPVTLVTRTKSGEDDEGNDVYASTSTTLDRVPVWPRTSSESTQGKDEVIVGLTAILPTGTDISAIDQVLVYGQSYEVEGEPAMYRSPFSNVDPGIEVNLKRITG